MKEGGGNLGETAQNDHSYKETLERQTGKEEG